MYTKFKGKIIRCLSDFSLLFQTNLNECSTSIEMKSDLAVKIQKNLILYFLMPIVHCIRLIWVTSVFHQTLRHKSKSKSKKTL